MADPVADARPRSDGFYYWPKDRPIPQGWEDTGALALTHHGAYSRLIRWKGEGAFVMPEAER